MRRAMHVFLNSKCFVVLLIVEWIALSVFVAHLLDHYHLWLVIFVPIVFWELSKFAAWDLRAVVQALIK